MDHYAKYESHRDFLCHHIYFAIKTVIYADESKIYVLWEVSLFRDDQARGNSELSTAARKKYWGSISSSGKSPLSAII